uniref:Uncharacterized protein n=1 Tax=Anopheles farauti TaxID=69004 RepID=A0A182QJY5_9DIPT
MNLTFWLHGVGDRCPRRWRLRYDTVPVLVSLVVVLVRLAIGSLVAIQSRHSQDAIVGADVSLLLSELSVLSFVREAVSIFVPGALVVHEIGVQIVDRCC